MRAIVLDSEGVHFDAEHAWPEPRAGEVPVRVLQAGICETDLQLMQGYMGFQGVLGHEFVGIAEDGPLKRERVVGEINCACRNCAWCEADLPTHCPHRSVLGILNHDGAFADSVSVPACNLHAVPDAISTDEAVFTEPLAAAFEIPAQMPLTAEMRVVVLGDGRLGNLCAQVAALHGCDVTVIGKHEQKLAVLDRLGIKTARLGDVTPNRDVDLVIDCTGSPTGLPTALEFVRPRGTIALKTTVAGEQRLALAPLVIDEITLIGSRCGPFPEALDALRSKQVDVLPLISKRYALNEGPAALAEAGNQPVLKVLLDVDNA